MSVSTALYRRYRPDTFADVIGQEHVTAPLVTALGKNAVSHAYLFSGPRGCGKTTSARILARCLNCEQGPTGMPCGECESCRDLSTGGSGSLDVIEIDAASHGGVDDARDLRERATFAPVRDRYKIFIIDEAHMVTAAGFNALLKIVEEPPEHIKFVFATTEPDKVIGTIRSRTHHYPFRLVPPEPLLEYLQRLCTEEQVPVDHGVLPLVIRAGGGSVRDTLSVLDQLIAGSEASGIDYDRAVALLGFTHASLLDDVVGAVAALDGATAFSVVDRVVQSGQDPRRFVEDLLERMRDLIIVKSMPENPGAILRGVPDDQIRGMQQQAAAVGHAELSRAADITAQALTDMVGATSPRLHLELLMARLLLPQAESGVSSLASRLERMERRLDFASEAGMTPAAPETPAAEAGAAEAAPTPSATPERPDDAAAGATQPVQERPQEPTPQPAQAPTVAAAESWGTAPNRSEPTSAPAAAQPAAESTPAPPADSSTEPAEESMPAPGAGSADEWATPGVPRAAEGAAERPEE
ncbi:DNA polymerase III subunit gamma and tau, partial [Nesterenkonia sp. F]|uniref:DNA polymerase III subunit gamma and tau n=1 Tax=Nesterenkonia sp. F TaxID=795955 RepID=UPI0011124A7A